MALVRRNNIMSSYRYTLSDYHAIQSADIKIDGITILAGENGCGKSTLSRWLYYIINGARLFEEFTLRNYERRVNRLLNRQNMAAREIRHYLQKDDDRRIFNYSYGRLNIPLKIENGRITEEDLQQFQEMSTQTILSFGEMLAEFLKKTNISARRDRILSYLGIDASLDEIDPGQVSEDFVEKNLRLLNQMTEKLHSDIENRSFKQFLDNIKNEYDETDMAPKNFQLYEDGVELIEAERISSLFNLRRAIYVDTPMALSNGDSNNFFWDELKQYAFSDREDIGFEEKKILQRIKNIIQGEAKVIELDSPFEEEELRYVSADKKINIEIEKTATGFRTFTYLQRLLENGYLTSETLLMIDEPEAHLHPQWVVEYARLLVLLQKYIGLKIMIATHNPDMVAALKSIAEREDILPNVNFYIAKSSSEPHMYEYRDLENEIGEIFESFNIALSRIQLYGTKGI